MDTGATNHITGELDKLTMHEKYRGNDPIYTAANGPSMEISHIGKSIIETPHTNLEHNDILHVLLRIFYLSIALLLIIMCF